MAKLFALLAGILFLMSGNLMAMSIMVDSFYVSPNGNDAWSGRLSEPNKDCTDGPCATLEGIRNAIRKYKNENNGLKRPVMVYLSKGVYYLDTPFILNSEDSGSKECPITYKGTKGTIISGGRIISGFREIEVEGKKMIAADIPEVKEGKWNFTQLFKNNQRVPRIRLPRNGYYKIAGLPDLTPETGWSAGQDRIQFNDGEVKASWKNLNDIEIVGLHFWIESRMKLKEVDEAEKIAKLDRKSTFRLTDEWLANDFARYYVENVFEEISPGEWYLDRSEGRLYYYPLAGEDWHKLQFIAPKLTHLIKLEGKENNKISNINIADLEFIQTEFSWPEGKAGSGQGAVEVPGAIFVQQATDCEINHCEFRNMGGYAIDINQGCSDIGIRSNKITDMAAGGIKVGHGNSRINIEDNDISDGGKVFHSALGIWVGNSGNVRIAHNLIHDLNYTGISVGWSWGYGSTLTENMVVEYNHIYNIGRGVLSDLGGIYTLGIQPNSFIRYNLIHDCYSHSYGGWGIYNDEGTTGYIIENNIVYNTKTGGYHQHYGKENKIRNNIFAFAKLYQVQRTKPEDHISFYFENNIIYYDQGMTVGPQCAGWNDDNFVIDNNLYYDASGRPLNFAGATLDEWRKRGHDRNSIVADPNFEDPKNYNFKLKPDSPALKIGFKPFELSSVGPREPAGIRE